MVAILSCPADWHDERQLRQMDDRVLAQEIQAVVAGLPRYCYWRVWGILRRERNGAGQAGGKAKRVYRVLLTVSRPETMLDWTQASPTASFELRG